MVMWIKEDFPRVNRDLISMKASPIVSTSRNTDISVFYANCFL